MFKSFTKYFSLFLIIFLINSNYSYTFTQMLCNMSKVKTECECESASGMHLDTKESECCKVKTHEINNSNTLEKNKTSHKYDITVQTVVYFLPHINIINSTSHSRIQYNLKIPITDIPILYSSLLI